MSDQAIKLLPCPFCGSEPMSGETRGGLYITCGNDDCHIEVSTKIAFDEQDALDIIADWNRRPKQENLGQREVDAIFEGAAK